MTKFFEEFTNITNGEFPELKLSRATYNRAEHKLVVRFIISAYALRAFGDDKKAKVKDAVDKLFAGVDVEVIYTPTYADKNVVKNKVLEFFNATNQMIFRRLDDSSLSIEVGEEDIKIVLRFDAAICKILRSGNFDEKLTDWLDRSFNHNVEVIFEECEDGEEEEYDATPSAVVRDSNLRLINFELGSRIYAKGKIETVAQLPKYICDVKGEVESITLCGRVSNVSRRTYRNKKYNASDPKSGPEFKPIASFTLDDTTGHIECVCFPRVDDANCFDVLEDGMQVVCVGRVGTDTYKNALSYAVNAVFNAKIDFEHIQTFSSKTEPEFYSSVAPEPYSTSRQTSFMDEDDPREKAYFKGRTFVVFDLETTSKFTSEAEIIEIGAIKIVDGAETSSFCTLVKPSASIPYEASEINHITDDMVANAPTIDKVIPDFYKFTRGAILAGHNIVKFDLEILNRIAKDHGYRFANEAVDTLDLARTLMTERNNFKLESIARDMKFKHTSAHRALSDVEANVALLRELARRGARI